MTSTCKGVFCPRFLKFIIVFTVCPPNLIKPWPGNYDCQPCPDHSIIQSDHTCACKAGFGGDATDYSDIGGCIGK